LVRRLVVAGADAPSAVDLADFAACRVNDGGAVEVIARICHSPRRRSGKFRAADGVCGLVSRRRVGLHLAIIGRLRLRRRWARDERLVDADGVGEQRPHNRRAGLHRDLPKAGHHQGRSWRLLRVKDPGNDHGKDNQDSGNQTKSHADLSFSRLACLSQARAALVSTDAPMSMSCGTLAERGAVTSWSVASQFYPTPSDKIFA